MQIIIIGAGQTGSSLAASLVAEHDITIIDIDGERLHELQSQFDLRTIHGYGSYPSILAEAGAAGTDMIIAVTDHDETNMMACFVAESMFKIPIKIARVRASDYFLNNGKFFAAEHSPADIFINPATLMTHTIVQLIQYPGALRIFDFANNHVKLVATKPLESSLLLGKTANSLAEYLPNTAAKIIAIYRRDEFMPLENTLIEIDDDILFIAANKATSPVLALLRPNISDAAKNKRIMIIGGGHIGSQLAKNLEAHHQVKLIEKKRDLCEQLAQYLSQTVILNGNGCDTALLNNEEIENIDCFCAVTNNDTDNIVSGLYSKQLGAKQVLALVNRDAYLDLIINSTIKIDIAFSPQQIFVSAILKHLRHGNIIHAYSLRRGLAEALEILISSKANVTGKAISKLQLPKGVEVCAIIRNQILILPKNTEIIQPADSVIIFISDKSKIPEVEQLFAINDEPWNARVS